MGTQRGVSQTTTWFKWQLQMYPSHISSMIRKRLWQEKPYETWEGSSQPSGRREEEEDVVSDPRQSPGTAIKPAHSTRNYAMGFIGHPIAMSSFSINNPLYESIVPERTFSCPTNMNGRLHFHLIDWLSICALGATACLLCRWEPGSV